MEEGSLRCDANVSLRPVGQVAFGTRTEIKNLNSFRFVERALEYEIARQAAILKSGKAVVQETLLFDSDTGVTKSLRSKEEASDYRYFADPDLPPLIVEESWIRDIRSRMPELPADRFKVFVEAYGLSRYDAGVLTAERSYADFFDRAFKVCSNAKAACNWITSELFGMLNKVGLDLARSPITPESIGELVKLIDDDVISGKMAKTVFEDMFASGRAPRVIVEEKGLQQITSEEAIAAVVRDVFEKNPSQAGEYVGGNARLHGFFVGQVMKATGGNANPKKVNDLISREVEQRKGRG
jgi:aspartyl-tRNA(Asn)/glutamyl-tRNA(Gln) amidotransferase subunit B